MGFFRITNKTFWFSILLVAVVLFTFAGCSGNSTPTSTNAGVPAATSSPTPTTALTAQEIADRALSAAAKLTTYQYNLGMSLKMAGTIEGQSQNINISASGDGANDVTNQKMQMNLNMDLEAPGQGKMSIPMSMYSVDGWQYVKVSVPFTGTQWIKNKMDMKSFEALDSTQQILQMLKSSVKLNLAGSENVDGTACYVVEVNPDLTVLSEWLKSFQGTANVTGSEPDVDFAKFVKNMSIKQFIAKDTFILKKADIAVSITLNGSDIGGTAQTGDNLTMDMAETITMTQNNQPLNIILPSEAQNAQDMTGKN